MKPISKHISFARMAGVLMIACTGMTASVSAQAFDFNDLFGSSAKKGKFLPVDEAFRVSPSVQGNKLSVTFNITKGHYVYRDKLKLTLPAGVTASKFTFNQKPYMVKDPTFGKVAVFDNSRVTATTTLKSTKNLSNAPISLKWQGCAKAGLCYPPEKVKLTMNLKKK